MHSGGIELLPQQDHCGGSKLGLLLMLLFQWAHVGNILGLYRDDGKENGKCYGVLGLYWDHYKKMETTRIQGLGVRM